MTKQSFMTVLVGPSELLREGLSRILDTAKFRILFSAACVHDLLQKPLPQHRPILLILDVGGTDADAEFAQIADFKAICSNSHVVVLADHCRSSDIVSAFRAGADAYLSKVAPSDTFIKALELVMLGQTVLPVEPSTFIQDIRHDLKYDAVTDDVTVAAAKMENVDRDLSILSDREKCILRCLIKGDSNKTIAREIRIAEATVKVHVKAILRKIRVRNRTQAAVWAMNHGVLTPATGPSGNEKMATQPSHFPQDLFEARKGYHFLENAHPI
ncbi:MAG: response regulator transcription factor [Mesorhizobium sp.]|uniref:LuxR C-terminal-related transcriptional regulator n=1 Tax=unclassified Mesorhizobium TaxID=325217 RepID=UPI000F753FB5|nr:MULTISPECIES: response regulator transcription factor [unclassified Mesorhizobium]RVD74019.1 response regulator transcription factor [Mesorhizobium sp. M4A.F.Ca.ET.029.04.2.1]AZO48405.1 response regulator transcription factor [Mesorhizobium sp. M4B.F.Ca.ET.058.02.1.1]RUX50956.1 response regulator transcription factor [Mesorhizobium sp. M4A.F.Ca.ET.050.02.1.1]RVC44455.1 response regulator transcription factor [Mesorhizobium sp. M4A.F.Ca.ET.090.04.2.1]RVC78412.1 response regulator transcripti